MFILKDLFQARYIKIIIQPQYSPLVFLLPRYHLLLVILKKIKKKNLKHTNLSLRFKKEKENIRSQVVHTVSAESHFSAPLRLMVFSGKFYILQKFFSLIYSFPPIHYLVNVNVPVLIFSKFIAPSPSRNSSKTARA